MFFNHVYPLPKGVKQKRPTGRNSNTKSAIDLDDKKKVHAHTQTHIQTNTNNFLLCLFMKNKKLVKQVYFRLYSPPHCFLFGFEISLCTRLRMGYIVSKYRTYVPVFKNTSRWEKIKQSRKAKVGRNRLYGTLHHIVNKDFLFNIMSFSKKTSKKSSVC